MASAVKRVRATRFRPDFLGFFHNCAVIIRSNLGTTFGHPAYCTGMAAFMGFPKAEKEDTVYR